jgi:hypothetical protein
MRGADAASFAARPRCFFLRIVSRCATGRRRLLETGFACGRAGDAPPCQLLQALLKTIEGTGEDLRLALGSHVRGRLQTAPLPARLCRPLLLAGKLAVLIPESSRSRDPIVQLRGCIRPDP